MRGDKSLIGKLMPGSAQQKKENLRITFIPRQTGIAETFDVNAELLDGFIFYSDGYYEVAYDNNLLPSGQPIASGNSTVLARLETIIPDRDYAGRKIEYFMKDKEITVSGKDETKEQANIFRIPSEWVNAPHLKIRYDDKDGRFYLASYGEKTIVNETQIPSSSHSDLRWVHLPLNSRIVLNGIVGVNIFKA
jgi:hypothetical protein